MTVPLVGRLGRALVCVITIVDEEFSALSDALGAKAPVPRTKYVFRNALANGYYDVVLAQTSDRSNGPCQELVRDLAEDLRPEFMILAGIAGGVKGRDGVCLGDVVIPDHVDCYEMRKMVDRKDVIRRKALDHPSLLLRDSLASQVRQRGTWQSKITLPRPEAGIPKAIVGNLIAGEKLFGDSKNTYQNRIMKEFDKAIAVDMESYGMGRGALEARRTRHYNLNYAIVRGISDYVDTPGNDSTRVQWRDYAAAAAGAFTRELVDELVAAFK